MAAITLVCAQTTHDSAINTKATLEALGHTVTLVDDGDILSHDFSGTACIVAIRNEAITATVANKLRALVDSGGFPLLLGMEFFGGADGAGRVGIPTRMNLTGTLTIVDFGSGVDSINIITTSHPITAGLSTGNLAVTADDNFWGVSETPGENIGTVLSLGQSGNATIQSMVETIAIETGTNDLDTPAVPTGARIVVAGWAYFGQSSPTAEGAALLGAAINWLLGGGGGGGGNVRRTSTGLSVGLGI